ncbi:MAG: hypothetical protein Q8877_03295, partial [Sweet potato little leaf phytoplasma]|nr:hypothetical protein [Sweet potato little leaf phytoplasma]
SMYVAQRPDRANDQGRTAPTVHQGSRQGKEKKQKPIPKGQKKQHSHSERERERSVTLREPNQLMEEPEKTPDDYVITVIGGGFAVEVKRR